MNSREAIKISIETADMIAKAYLADLTDEEMMHRPDPGCNHIKWQIGHLIVSDNEMINGCCPGALPELPPRFKEQYDKLNCTSDESSDFHDKSELLQLFDQQRAAAMAKLNALSDQDFDAPAPESIASYAPTLGAVYAMIGIHWTMHTGQWAVIRRQLGREPVL